MIDKLKTLLSVGAIAYILYLFTFSIDGEMGVVLIAFFLLTPLISFGFALYARNRVKVSLFCDGYVKKGSDLTVRVAVEKTGRFPFAIIEIIPSASEVFEKQNKKYRLSMLFEDRAEFTFKVKAYVGGNGEICINELNSCGFLGFLKLRIKGVDIAPVSVGVIPEIPDVNPSSQLLRKVSDAVFTSDNSDECDTEMVFSAASTPGYEHREYVQGDPLKRVNWKLSTKKGKLMVRLDEAAASVQPLIILDLYRMPQYDAYKSVIVEEKILCSVFGLLKALVRQGISCNFVYTSGGETVVETVDNPDYPEILLLKALVSKVVPGHRIDIRDSGSSCGAIVATTAPLGDFNIVSDKLDTSNGLDVIVPEPVPYSTDHKLWYLDVSDNCFKVV